MRNLVWAVGIKTALGEHSCLARAASRSSLQDQRAGNHVDVILAVLRRCVSTGWSRAVEETRRQCKID